MSKKIAVMQPYFFPYIGYFQLMNCADVFVNLDDVNYINKGWINRNYILINSGPVMFTIPLKKSSQNKLIKDTGISYSNDWTGNFLKTIENNYKRAPYFKIIFEVLNKLILKKENRITDLVLNSFDFIRKYTGIKAQIVDSSSKYGNNDIRGSMRIIDICKKENCSHYVNPPGGKDLYFKDEFEISGIKLNFINSKDISYKQFDKQFVKNLSMIDVLMFNSPEEISTLLNAYELV